MKKLVLVLIVVLLAIISFSSVNAETAVEAQIEVDTDFVADFFENGGELGLSRAERCLERGCKWTYLRCKCN